MVPPPGKPPANCHHSYIFSLYFWLEFWGCHIEIHIYIYINRNEYFYIDTNTNMWLMYLEHFCHLNRLQRLQTRPDPRFKIQDSRFQETSWIPGPDPRFKIQDFKKLLESRGQIQDSRFKIQDWKKLLESRSSLDLCLGIQEVFLNLESWILNLGFKKFFSILNLESWIWDSRSFSQSWILNLESGIQEVFLNLESWILDLASGFKKFLEILNLESWIWPRDSRSFLKSSILNLESWIWSRLQTLQTVQVAKMLKVLGHHSYNVIIPLLLDLWAAVLVEVAGIGANNLFGDESWILDLESWILDLVSVVNVANGSGSKMLSVRDRQRYNTFITFLLELWAAVVVELIGIGANWYWS